MELEINKYKKGTLKIHKYLQFEIPTSNLPGGQKKPHGKLMNTSN